MSAAVTIKSGEIGRSRRHHLSGATHDVVPHLDGAVAVQTGQGRDAVVMPLVDPIVDIVV